MKHNRLLASKLKSSFPVARKPALLGECCGSLMVMMISLMVMRVTVTEDYEKVIIHYQTKEIALNVTSQMNLRYIKQWGNIIISTCFWKRFKWFSWLSLTGLLYVKEAEIKIGLETTLSFLFHPNLLLLVLLLFLLRTIV